MKNFRCLLKFFQVIVQGKVSFWENGQNFSLVNTYATNQRNTWSETVVGMLNQGSYRGDFTNVMLSFTWRFGGVPLFDLDIKVNFVAAQRLPRNCA